MQIAATRRPRIPALVVLSLVATLVVVAVALTTRPAHVTLSSTGGGPAIPSLSMVGARPTVAEVQRAFADHGLPLVPVRAVAGEPRFAPVRASMIGMWQVAGPGGFRIAIFRRAVGTLPSRMLRYPVQGDATTAASGRVYWEAGSRAVRTLMPQIRDALRELRAISTPR